MNHRKFKFYHESSIFIAITEPHYKLKILLVNNYRFI